MGFSFRDLLNLGICKITDLRDYSRSSTVASGTCFLVKDLMSSFVVYCDKSALYVDLYPNFSAFTSCWADVVVGGTVHHTNPQKYSDFHRSIQPRTFLSVLACDRLWRLDFEQTI